MLFSRCQRRRALLKAGQTGRQTKVENLSTFDNEQFGIINPVAQLPQGIEFYQMGEEGNSPGPYEMHTTRYMQRLVFRDFTISNKYPNNVVLVKHLGVCVVHKLVLDRKTDSFQAILSPFVKQTDFFRGSPCNSSDFDIYRVFGGLGDARNRKWVNANDIVNQFVCILSKKVVDVDADRTEEAQLHPTQIARRDLNKQQSEWVCIPLIHGRQ